MAIGKSSFVGILGVLVLSGWPRGALAKRTGAGPPSKEKRDCDCGEYSAS